MEVRTIVKDVVDGVIVSIILRTYKDGNRIIQEALFTLPDCNERAILEKNRLFTDDITEIKESFSSIQKILRFHGVESILIKEKSERIKGYYYGNKKEEDKKPTIFN